MEITSRYDIKIIPEDVKQIIADSIAQYEKATGKILQPAHIERLIIDVYAFRKLLIAKALTRRFVKRFRKLPPVWRWIYAVNRWAVTDCKTSRHRLFCALA